MNTKPAVLSKTIWLNAAVFAVALGAFLVNQDFIKQFPQLTAGIGAVVAFLNIVLRLFTNTGINLGGNNNP